MKHLEPKLDDLLIVKKEHCRIIAAPINNNSFKLEDLVSRVTHENLHAHISFGVKHGKELL